MMISKAMLAATFAFAAPAFAQAGYGPAAPTTMPPPASNQAQAAAPAQAPTRPYNLSRAERTAFAPVVTAVNAHNWAVAQTTLDAASPAAQSADAKYLVGQLRLQIGVGTNNSQLESQGVDEMIASGGARPNELAPLYQNQIDFATQAGDTAKAERAIAQLQAINPNNPALLLRRAQLREAAHDAPGAIAIFQQAIQAQQTAGQPIPVEWRQQMVSIAYRAHLPQASSLMHEWLVAAPTPALWHDTIVIYAEQYANDSALKLDAYRLARAAGAMTSEHDYVTLAQAAADAHAIGEVKVVLDEGLSRNLIRTNAAFARERLATVNPRISDDRASLVTERRNALAGHAGTAALRLGDSYYGYGQYAEAAELYRAALQQGGVDANVANTRLGASLAMAGQRAQAEAAFHAVTGPRAELAQLWLLWLSTHHA